MPTRREKEPDGGDGGQPRNFSAREQTGGNSPGLAQDQLFSMETDDRRRGAHSHARG